MSNRKFTSKFIPRPDLFTSIIHKTRHRNQRKSLLQSHHSQIRTTHFNPRFLKSRDTLLLRKLNAPLSRSKITSFHLDLLALCSFAEVLFGSQVQNQFPPRGFAFGLSEAEMEHPIRASDSHCEVICTLQELFAAAQESEFLKARKHGPEVGSSEGPALMAPRRRGSGRGKGIRVVTAEKQSESGGSGGNRPSMGGKRLI